MNILTYTMHIISISMLMSGAVEGRIRILICTSRCNMLTLTIQMCTIDTTISLWSDTSRSLACATDVHWKFPRPAPGIPPILESGQNLNRPDRAA